MNDGRKDRWMTLGDEVGRRFCVYRAVGGRVSLSILVSSGNGLRSQMKVRRSDTAVVFLLLNIVSYVCRYVLLWFWQDTTSSSLAEADKIFQVIASFFRSELMSPRMIAFAYTGAAGGGNGVERRGQLWWRRIKKEIRAKWKWRRRKRMVGHYLCHEWMGKRMILLFFLARVYFPPISSGFCCFSALFLKPFPPHLSKPQLQKSLSLIRWRQISYGGVESGELGVRERSKKKTAGAEFLQPIRCMLRGADIIACSPAYVWEEKD